MSKFSRGTVVHHKVMGIGVAINESDDNDGMVEVRMKNGQKEKFYPEELETQEEVNARNKRMSDEINAANARRIDPYS